MVDHSSPAGHLVYSEDGNDVRVLFCGGPRWEMDPKDLEGLLLSEALPDDFDGLIAHYRKGLDGPHTFEYDFMGVHWRSEFTPLGVWSGRRCAHLRFTGDAP